MSYTNFTKDGSPPASQMDGSNNVTTLQWNNLIDLMAGNKNEVNFPITERDATYIIRKNGANTEAVNASTGKIDFTNTDSATVFNSALAGGGTIFYKGIGVTFGISARLLIPSNTRLTSDMNAILQLNTNVNDRMFSNSVRGTSYTGNLNIEIDHCIIDGNNANQSAIGPTDVQGNAGCIDLRGCTNVSIHDNHIYNSWAAGIELEYVKNYRIENNYVHDTSDDNISPNQGSLNGVINGNICLNAGSTNLYGSPHGIEIEDGVTDVVCSNNYCASANQDGIFIGNHAGVTPACSYITVTGNVCDSNGDVGIKDVSVSGAADNNITIIGNFVRNSGSASTHHGISVAGVSGANNQIFDFVIAGNVCSNNHGSGITLNQGIRILVEDNICDSNGTGAAGAGISLTAISWSVVKGNQARNNQLQGIVASSTCTDIMITGNMSIDNGAAVGGSQTGIQCNGNTCWIQGNRTSDTRAGGSRTQQHGIFVGTPATSCVVEYNYTDNNSSDQILDTGTTTIWRGNQGGGKATGISQMLSNDETDASGTVPNTDTNLKTYSLLANAYGQVIVEAEGEVDFTATSTNQTVVIKVKTGATTKMTQNVDGALAATAKVPFSIKTAFANTGAATLAVTMGAAAADANTTVILHSLRVYSVY